MKTATAGAKLRPLFACVGFLLALTVSRLPAADHYYVNDHLATTTAVTDAAGEIASIEADAFGSPVAGTEQAARYTGKPYDSDIGAYVFPYRNYRSDEARWMSADPSGFPDGVNAQAYAPKPNCEFDPLGLATYIQKVNNDIGWDVTVTYETLFAQSGLSANPQSDSMSPGFYAQSRYLFTAVVASLNATIRYYITTGDSDPVGKGWSITKVVVTSNTVTLGSSTRVSSYIQNYKYVSQKVTSTVTWTE